MDVNEISDLVTKSISNSENNDAKKVETQVYSLMYGKDSLTREGIVISAKPKNPDRKPDSEHLNSEYLGAQIFVFEGRSPSLPQPNAGKYSIQLNADGKHIDSDAKLAIRIAYNAVQDYLAKK